MFKRERESEYCVTAAAAAAAVTAEADAVSAHGFCSFSETNGLFV